MYHIGDKVFYPRNGAGIIKSIEEKEVLGTMQAYYIVVIPNSKMDIMIPVSKATSIGLRPIASSETLMDVISYLKDECFEDDLSWKERQKINNEKLKSGKIEDTAEIYKDLSFRSKEKHLNSYEKQLYSQVKKYLVSEISMIKDINENEATDLLAM